ncbi:MAG: hypothetical protein Q9174_005587, partial [Haloplaca sp. 1 TL-2023]
MSHSTRGSRAFEFDIILRKDYSGDRVQQHHIFATQLTQGLKLPVAACQLTLWEASRMSMKLTYDPKYFTVNVIARAITETYADVFDTTELKL